MALALSTRLGPYEVIAVLGAGDTGEVFGVRDTDRSDECHLGGLSVEKTPQTIGVSIRTSARDHGFARDCEMKA